MAIKQYIGARYVPKFATPIEWQENTAYEGMTIVTYNNSSYTSKKSVPTTVGIPPQNDEYWALTGNYNAQVEEYRQDTLTYKETVEGYKEEVDKYKNDTDSKFTKQNNYNHRNFILIGDSFSIGVNGDNNKTVHTNGGWIKRFANSIKNSNVYYDTRDYQAFYGSVYGGAFSITNSYLSKLKYIEEDNDIDADTITDIVVMGGTNEPSDNSTQIENDMQTFITYCQEKYRNARIKIGCLTTHMKQLVTNDVVKVYRNCSKYGAEYISDSFNLYCLSSFVGNDGTHLTEDGYLKTYEYTNNLILNGKASYVFTGEVTINFPLASGEKDVHFTVGVSNESMNFIPTKSISDLKPCWIALLPQNSKLQINMGGKTTIGSVTKTINCYINGLFYGDIWRVYNDSGVQTRPLSPFSYDFTETNGQLTVYTSDIGYDVPTDWNQYLLFKGFTAYQIN